MRARRFRPCIDFRPSLDLLMPRISPSDITTILLSDPAPTPPTPTTDPTIPLAPIWTGPTTTAPTTTDPTASTPPTVDTPTVGC
jgi:hypothetical protein